MRVYLLQNQEVRVFQLAESFAPSIGESSMLVPWAWKRLIPGRSRQRLSVSSLPSGNADGILGLRHFFTRRSSISEPMNPHEFQASPFTTLWNRLTASDLL
jgi:hypothetical protein